MAQDDLVLCKIKGETWWSKC